MTALYWNCAFIFLWTFLLNSDFLNSEALDDRLTQHVRNSISFVDFEESPSRVLDLGCGVSDGDDCSIVFCS